jgi:hypothetical protein
VVNETIAMAECLVEPVSAMSEFSDITPSIRKTDRTACIDISANIPTRNALHFTPMATSTRNRRLRFPWETRGQTSFNFRLILSLLQVPGFIIGGSWIRTRHVLCVPTPQLRSLEFWAWTWSPRVFHAFIHLPGTAVFDKNPGNMRLRSRL